jgi:hypothetical protein
MTRCFDGSVLYPLDWAHMLLLPVEREPLTTRPPHNCCRHSLMRTPSRLWRQTFPSWMWQRDESGWYTGEELYDALTALAVACFAVTIGMLVLNRVWAFFDPAFKNIDPPHKRMYVVANIFKSFMLGIMVLSPRWWTGNAHAFAHDDFLAVPMKRTVMLYVATDVVALYLVEKLPLTTKIHHYAATVLAVIVCAIDCTEQGFGGGLGVAKMIIVYGNFSTLAFLVNAFLALRVVHPDHPLTWWLSLVALFSYIACCAGNWGIHAWWLIHCFTTGRLGVPSALYGLLLTSVINDDIVLINWLLRYQKKRVDESLGGKGAGEGGGAAAAAAVDEKELHYGGRGAAKKEK